MDQRAAGFLLAGVAILAALFLYFRPAPPPLPPAPSAAPRIFTIVVEDGRRAAGQATLQVHKGETVILRVTSDRPDSLHLHGYDLILALAPGVPAELRFVANRSGRFEYELHRAHAVLGALEVRPH